jgi:hypothetical protein
MLNVRPELRALRTDLPAGCFQPRSVQGLRAAILTEQRPMPAGTVVHRCAVRVRKQHRVQELRSRRSAVQAMHRCLQYLRWADHANC